jgi:hypothetical protein
MFREKITKKEIRLVKSAMKMLTVVTVMSLITLSFSGCLGGTGHAQKMNQSSNGNVTYYPDGYYDNYGFWHSYYHYHWYSRYFYDDYYGTSYPRSYSSVAYVAPTKKSYKTVVAEKKQIIPVSVKSTPVKTVSSPSKVTKKVDLSKSSVKSSSSTYKSSSSYSSSSSFKSSRR